MWRPGDAILLREIHHGRVFQVLAATLISDGPDLVMLYWAEGSPMKAAAPTRDERRAIHQAGDDFELVDTAWKFTNVLYFVNPRDSHSTWLLWRDGDLVGWYINLQDPLVRTPLGFDTADLTLDIVVSPDTSSWRWKDEEEFDLPVSGGRMAPERAASLRPEGERALETLQERRWPFEERWEEWRPEPSWRMPAIPEGWERL